MKRLTWLLLIAVLTSQIQAAVPEPVSIWEFDGPDTNRATVGVPLELVGSVQQVAGITVGDGAVQIGEGSYFICTHGVAPNGGGAKVNEWTLLIDFSYPPSSRSDPPNGYNDLFQTNPTNVDDADWTINSAGGIGIGAVGYSSAHGYTTKGDTWYRLIVVVDNGTRHDIYVDGVEIFKGTQQGVDGRFSLADRILLFCAGNNQDRDDAPINVSTVAFWDAPLSANEIAIVGRAGDSFFTRKGASNPVPANGADNVVATTDLAWAPGKYAATHTVYFSTSREDVDAAAASALLAEGLHAESLDIGQLDFGQTYYWRVDEVNGVPDGTVFPGDVWSFTVEPYAYPITSTITATASSSQAGLGPVNVVNGAGLDDLDQHSTEASEMWMTDGSKPAWIQFEFDKVYKLQEMWVWNSNQLIEAFLGFGAKSVKIECSADGQTWTTLEGVPEFAKASSKATYTANTVVDFGGVTARFVKLTIESNWGGVAPQTGLSEVRFFYVPVQAFEPQPAAGATGISVETALGWRPGREATSHTVFLGTDSAAVDAGSVAGDAVEEPAYTPASLDFATTYYWKVDETGDVGTYAGDVWDFTTEDYASIEDFESYNDDDNRIYDAWIDGLTDAAKGGSQVGYDVSPFAEKTVVHGGIQSMPLLYNNVASPFYSEAERTFSPALDLTAHGADSLRVYFCGMAEDAGNSKEGFYLTVKDSSNKSKTVMNPDPAATVSTTWQAWVIPLSEFTAAGVKMNAVKTITIGVGNRTSPTSGGAGKVLIDDIGFGCPLTP